MNYYVARDGQTYGPYSLETVQKYLNEGTILAGDMARTDAMPNWVPLRQLLTPPVPPQQQGFAPPPPSYPPQPPFAAPAYPPQQQPGAGAVNVPPDLHWALVLLITALTGVFSIIWAFVQSNFIRRIDPTSTATRDLIIGILAPIGGFIVFFILLITGGGLAALSGLNENSGPAAVGAIAGSIGLAALMLCALSFVGLIFHIKAIFGMKHSMERYYNTVEPINLRLSAVMTFFFNILYLQYHMSRIAEWKRTGILRP
jgi:hypothetical protein